jgi:predicted Fe-Mo cluster-binding NifX family protein
MLQISSIRRNEAVFRFGTKNAWRKGMENLGITIWNDLVSPLFDASCTIRVMTGTADERLLDIKTKSLKEKAACCRENGIHTLICGAISNIAHGLLVENGVTVLGWIQGPVDDIVEAFIAGEELVPRFAMPGCNQYRRNYCRGTGTGRKRWRRGAGGRGCGGRADDTEI